MLVAKPLESVTTSSISMDTTNIAVWLALALMFVSCGDHEGSIGKNNT
jgi:hypothetical protein